MMPACLRQLDRASATKTPANLPQAPGYGVERVGEMGSNSLIEERVKWCRLRDSNPRPPDYKLGAPPWPSGALWREPSRSVAICRSSECRRGDDTQLRDNPATSQGSEKSAHVDRWSQALSSVETHNKFPECVDSGEWRSATASKFFEAWNKSGTSHFRNV